MYKIKYSTSALGAFYLVLLSFLFLCSIITVNRVFIYSINLISSFLFFIFLLKLLKDNIDFVAINAFLIINYIWFTLSLNFLEFGSYTPELEITGTPTGATVRFVYAVSIFIIFASLGYNLVRYKSKKLVNSQCAYIIAILLLMQCGVALVYLIYGTALSNHVDRVVFRNNIAPAGYFQMLTVMTFICYPLGRVRALGLLNRNILDFLFVIVIILLVLGGEKFSLLILAVCLYVISHKDGFKLSALKCLKIIGVLIFVSLGIIFLVNTQYENKGGNISENKIGLIFDRIAQQAQLNYFFDKEIFFKKEGEQVSDDFISNELIKNENSPQGIRLLMYKSSPVDIFNSYDKTGITFGDGFPAIIYLYFSWLSFFFMGFLGFFYGVIIKFCKKTLYEGNVIESLILMYLVYNVAMSVFLNGEFSLILEMTSTKWVSLLVLLALILYRCFGRISIRYP